MRCDEYRMYHMIRRTKRPAVSGSVECILFGRSSRERLEDSYAFASIAL